MTETLVFAFGFCLLVLVGGWFSGLFQPGGHRDPVKALALLNCPKCGARVGEREANTAYDRAADFHREHTFARVGPSDYSSARVVCEKCAADLIFWAVTRTLHLREEVNERSESTSQER